MKRFVVGICQGVGFGLGSLLLVGIIQAETAISYSIVLGLVAIMLLQSWTRRRREKARPVPGKP